MATSLISDSLVLLQAVSVIIVAAILISRSRPFKEVIDGNPTAESQMLLAIFFGMVSIYGSIIGINFLGAIISVRDLGPLVGGLACGPVVGTGRRTYRRSIPVSLRADSLLLPAALPSPWQA